MSAAQHQAFVIGNVSFVAFLLFVCFALSPRRTKFSIFAACNLLFVALMFYAVAFIDLPGGRTEVALAIMTELPVMLIVGWVCLALAGRSPSQLGAIPVEPVARRPWLRTALRTAPLLLALSVGGAVFVGFLWPSPAMRVYAPAPPAFFVLKLLITTPQVLYSGLAALIFAMASRSPGLKKRLRFKNLAFSLGMLCIAAIALESAVFAGLRVWASGGSRRAVLETLNTIEASLAITCIIAFIVGLSLRYTPAVAGPLLHRLQTGWLLAQEQFESFEWRAVTGGAAERLTNASSAVVLACRLRNVSESDTERALATIRLIAVIEDPSSETQSLTPEAARKLYQLQQEILCDEELASKISWMAGPGNRAKEPQTVKSAPLHDALSAALDLIDPGADESCARNRPLWFWIVAASAMEAKIIESPPEALARLEDRPEYLEAVQVYRAACNSVRATMPGE